MKSSLSDYYLQLYGIVVVRIVVVCVVQFVSAQHISLRVRSAIRHFCPSLNGRHFISLTCDRVPSPQTESQAVHGDHLSSQTQSAKKIFYALVLPYK